MSPEEVRFIEIARRCFAIGLRAANAYDAEQKELDLSKVLSKDRLATSAGTQVSIETLNRLAELTRQHREVFANVVAFVASALAKAIDELPAGLQEKYRAELMGTINAQLEKQSEFYLNRERWIAAAREICDLVNSRRERFDASDAGLEFHETQDLDRYRTLLTAIQEVHQFEVGLLTDRVKRIANGARALGLLTPQK
jgi:hypothetical protein